MESNPKEGDADAATWMSIARDPAHTHQCFAHERVDDRRFLYAQLALLFSLCAQRGGAARPPPLLRFQRCARAPTPEYSWEQWHV